MWDFSTGTLFMLKRAVEQGAPVSFFLIAFLGLCSGSFLSVVVYRLSTILARIESDGDGMQATSRFNIATPASHCRKCGHKIRWVENIPIISYICMRAKCGSCGGKISITYPALEFLMCMAAIVALWQFRSIPLVAGALLLSGSLICVSAIDLREKIIPDIIVLPMLWLGLICNIFELFTPLRDAVFGAVAGYLSLWGLFWVYKIATGKDGIGRGDFKLIAMLGAWLGVGAIPIILIISFTTGAAFGLLCMVMFRFRLASAIPFGPFLATAGWCTLYWSTEINQAYWNVALFFTLR
jgi:leader peptidase (prepilin peptidase)/N-methyltransferase